VPNQLLRYTLAYTGAKQIPHSGAAEIVPHTAHKVSTLFSQRPRCTDALYALPATVEHVRAIGRSLRALLHY
jgi:hypothetical protein